MVTRPEPTIYGNCDSWDFIVGKKPGAYSLHHASMGSLQPHNTQVINSIFTILVDKILNNLWVVCGSPVQPWQASRMVVFFLVYMP